MYLNDRHDHRQPLCGAVVNSEAQISVLSKIFYGSLSYRPRPVESIRLKGDSAYGVMVGCRVDGMEVDFGDGHGTYSMSMYVAYITDSCFLVWTI